MEVLIKFSLKKLRRKDSQAPFGTHLPILRQVLAALQREGEVKRVIEMGVGLYSTAALREIVLSRNVDARLYSLEGDGEWLRRVRSSLEEHDGHRLIAVDSSESWHSTLESVTRECVAENAVHGLIDLAFIDSAPWDSRTVGLLTLATISRVVVVHDVDYFPHAGLWGKEIRPVMSQRGKSGEYTFDEVSVGYRDYSDIFSSWFEIFPAVSQSPSGPPTLVGSNLLDLSTLVKRGEWDGVCSRP